MKKYMTFVLALVLLLFPVAAISDDSSGFYRIIASIQNITGLASNVIDADSTIINTTIGSAGRRVYARCFAGLRVTSLTGTAPNAAIFLDQSYDQGLNYDAIATFTACTAACNERKVAQFTGPVDAIIYPSQLRVRRTTSGTSVTDLDYEIYLMCADF